MTNHIDLAVDVNGQRYTTRCFAREGDPWMGALILTPPCINRLRSEGLLPLTEIEVSTHG